MEIVINLFLGIFDILADWSIIHWFLGIILAEIIIHWLKTGFGIV